MADYHALQYTKAILVLSTPAKLFAYMLIDFSLLTVVYCWDVMFKIPCLSITYFTYGSREHFLCERNYLGKKLQMPLRQVIFL